MRHHMTVDGPVPFTPEEEAEWDAREAAATSPEAIAAKVSAETTTAIQAMLDTKAREYRYDNIHTACGWADMFADALALKSWGAECWRKAAQIEAEVLAGARALPTAAEVIAEMPGFVL